MARPRGGTNAFWVEGLPAHCRRRDWHTATRGVNWSEFCVNTPRDSGGLPAKKQRQEKNLPPERDRERSDVVVCECVCRSPRACLPLPAPTRPFPRPRPRACDRLHRKAEGKDATSAKLFAEVQCLLLHASKASRGEAAAGATGGLGPPARSPAREKSRAREREGKGLFV